MTPWTVCWVAWHKSNIYIYKKSVDLRSIYSIQENSFLSMRVQTWSIRGGVGYMLWSRRKYTPTRSCSYVAVLGGGLLLMKDSGGERMHYPYWECILSPTDFDIGSVCWDSVCTHIGWRCSWVKVNCWIPRPILFSPQPCSRGRGHQNINTNRTVVHVFSLSK